MPKRLTDKTIEDAMRAYLQGQESARNRDGTALDEHAEGLRFAIEAGVARLDEDDLIELLARRRRVRLLAESRIGEGIAEQCPIAHEAWADRTDESIGLLISAMLSEFDDADGILSPDVYDFEGEDAQMRHDRVVDRQRKAREGREEGI